MIDHGNSEARVFTRIYTVTVLSMEELLWLIIQKLWQDRRFSTKNFRMYRDYVAYQRNIESKARNSCASAAFGDDHTT
jgi:hypothetical protein